MMRINEGKVINIRITERRVNNNIVRLSQEITDLLDENKIKIETIRFHLDMIEFWQETLDYSEQDNTPLWCDTTGYDEDE